MTAATASSPETTDTGAGAPRVLDLRAVFGLTAHVTMPADATGGAYVEMECFAEPGSATVVHCHPEQEESYAVAEGVLDVLLDGRWGRLGAGASLVVPPGAVHAFRNRSDAPVRFSNRHTPALGFQAHLETVDRLVRAGKVRGTRDPRSLIYLAMSAAEHRPDITVRPPQRVVNLLAWLGRRLGFRLDE